MDRKDKKKRTQRTCGFCLYSSFDEFGDMVCVNGDSEYCADYIDDKHTCVDYTHKMKGGDDY